MSTRLPKLARYEVLGRLATGGMAEVWLARAVGVAGFEKLVVLKTILPQLVENPTFVSMFVNEGRLAAMLNHPNCVQIFELGQEGSTLFLAMEYLEGFSLSRLLKRAKDRQMPPSESVLARIIMDAASGLDYAHRLKDREGRALGLVHRDVSPDNLLISFSGQTKVVDFGIAKAVTPQVMAATVAGTIKGKHGFIAPEYLLGQPIDGRADVFALGVVLYRALTRMKPFGGTTDAAISMSVLNDAPRPPSVVAPHVSAALSGVVMMALEKKPIDRFESARAMRQALEVAVGRPADTDDVADYMNMLWPPDDAERLALQSLATANEAEESSGPALKSVVSGTYNLGSMATPAHAPAAGLHATPPTAEEMTRNLVRPRVFDEVPKPVAAPTPAAETSASFDAVPVFDPPPKRSVWPIVAVVILLSLGGGGVWMKLRPQQAVAAATPVEVPAQPVATAVVVPSGTGVLKLAPPVVVKVFDGKDELGSTPLELTRPAGTYTLHLVNKSVGLDQSVTLTVGVGDVVELPELAKGVLVVKAEPWAEVKVDGKSYGQTPVTVRGLYEGVHVVTANNLNLHEMKRAEAKIKGGETKTLSFDFEAE